jgi:hypothetical protein
LLTHAGLRHRNDIGNGHGTRGCRPAQPGGDFGTVPCFDIVDGTADDGSRHRAGHGSNGRPGQGITDSGPGDGAQAASHHAAEQGSAIGRVRRRAARGDSRQ